MDPLTIAGLVAMIASAGVQAYSQQAAAKKQQQAAMQAHQRQQAAQNEATKVAAAKAEEFAPDKRNEQQAQIEQALNEGYAQQIDKPMVTAQGVEVGTTIDGGHTDYTAAKARESAKTKASLHALAGLMSRIGSAGELRRNEAVGIGNAATDIGRIQTGAGNMAGIDQLGIQAAGRPSIGLQLASGALNAAGMAGMAGAFGGVKPPVGSYANPDMMNVVNVPRGSWLR